MRHGNKKCGVATWHENTCDICGDTTDVTEPRDFGHLKDTWEDAAKLAAVTEQRDGLKQAVDCASDLLASVTEQRDRLAEAGKDLLKNLYNINDDGGKIATIRRMKEALQSLTLNKL
jgi:hypothetical protein